MEIISDLQIHSSFSRACSKNITFERLENYARIKGLNLLGTGDFQHPKQNEIIKEKLKEDENGILWSKSEFPFIWQTEISLIYTDNGKGQRIHHLIYAPNKDVADQIIDFLKSKGRVDYDGRPIFGFTSVELVESMVEISKDIEIIPAHVWTSHYALMGQYNQLKKVEDCFKEKTKFIHALETGMSSDPAMNFRLSSLDKFQLVSFSDSHSFWPYRLGREATIFDFKELTYNNFIKAIRTGNNLKNTIETPVFYGKYHYSGHANCGVFVSPDESKKLRGICPKCGNKLTIGVADRIELLADRPEGYIREDAKPFVSVIPLQELIAAVYDVKQLNGKKIWEIYNKLIKEFGNEFNILLNISFDDLKKIVDERLANIIIKNRNGELNINPGADGVYGKIILDDREKINIQKSLNQF